MELTGTIELPLKVSENKMLLKNLFYGFLGNCLITRCFLLIISETLQGVKIKLCVMIALFSYFCKNVILKWVEVSDFWEGHVEK